MELGVEVANSHAQGRRLQGVTLVKGDNYAAT